MQITRRRYPRRAAAAGAAGRARTSRSAGPPLWSRASVIPIPAVKVLDPSFTKYRVFNASVERLATGMRWSEGPVWFGDARCVLWSDIPNNRIMRWDEETRRVSIYRKPSNYANGNTRDRQGRLVTCEHDARRVTRTEYDGTVTVLIDKFDGKPLNSPNDVVVKSDDSIWFTDPRSGIGGNYEGHVATKELPTNVYRLDPASGQATVVIGDLVPNGLCFSPDETKLYLVDYSATPFAIRVYDVTGDGSRLANGRAFVTCAPGETPDGFRCDTDGNLWCGWGGGEGIATASPFSIRTGSASAQSRCRSAAPISVSAASSATACSWRRATRSIRFMWGPKARSAADERNRMSQSGPICWRRNESPRCSRLEMRRLPFDGERTRMCRPERPRPTPWPC